MPSGKLLFKCCSLLPLLGLSHFIATYFLVKFNHIDVLLSIFNSALLSLLQAIIVPIEFQEG